MNITNWERRVACGERVFVENVGFTLIFDVDELNKLVSHFVDEPTEEEL